MINDQETRLSAIYKRPAFTLQLADIDSLLDSTLPTILAGDLNAKHIAWQSHSINTAGRTLYSSMDNGEFNVFAPTTPTHYPD